MSIKRGLIKNTAFNLGGYTYLLLASFFSISLLLKNLGRDTFGIYVLLASVVPLASVFDLGLATAVVRKLSLPQTTDEEKKKVWQTSFFVFLLLAIFLGFIVFIGLNIMANTFPVLANVDRGILNTSFITLSFTVVINHINSHLLTLPQANQRFDVFNSKTLFVGSANTILSALLSIIRPNIASLYQLQLLFHIATFIFMSSYCYSFFKGKNFLPKFNLTTGKDLISFGLKNFVGTLVSQIESQLSNYFLGSVASARAITSYNIPQNIVIKGSGIVSQVAQAFFPFSASLLEKDRIRKLKKMLFNLQSLVMFGGFLAILLSFTVGKTFLLWWLKDAVIVDSAYPILKILSFYFFLNSLTPIPSALIQGLNKPQITSFFAVLTVSIEAILMFILVKPYGAIGAAYATLLSSCLTVPLFLITTAVLLEKEIKRLSA